MKITNGKFQYRIWSLLFTTLLLSFYFIYFLLRIKPQLIYQVQQPVFFFDKYFIIEFFNYPGGVNELISNFFSQFFYYSWTGALLLAIVFGLISWNTKLLIQSINANRPVIYLHWIPSIFLLALHSNYRFPLILTLGLLWALINVNISIHYAPKNHTSRFLFYIFIHTITYYLIAGQVFIFSAIITIFEVLYHRRIILPLLYIIFAGLLPYIAASYLFILNVQDAYVIHLTTYTRYGVTRLSWILYGFFPLAVLLLKFKRKHNERKKKSKKNHKEIRPIPIRLAQGIILLALVAISGFYSYDKNAKAFLLIDHYARSGKWDKVLDMAQKGFPISNIAQCQVNRALYHSGLLCDKLFSIAQLFGGSGLFMRDSLRSTFSLQHSDIFLDLGLINTSEQWAYEAIATNGDTAWNLQRLALVNLLKEKDDIAAKYLKMLQKTLWHRNWAIEYQKYLSDSKDFWANPRYQYIKNTMPETDFLISPTEPELCLEEMLNNTKNKMAFEYFMAYCLLDGKISQFMKHLHRLNYFDYPKIPRYFEEAILIYNQLTDSKGITLPGKEISQETIRKYDDFNKIMEKHKRNKIAARRELEKYRDTYWFYGLYYYKPGEK